MGLSASQSYMWENVLGIGAEMDGMGLDRNPDT